MESPTELICSSCDGDKNIWTCCLGVNSQDSEETEAVSPDEDHLQLWWLQSRKGGRTSTAVRNGVQATSWTNIRPRMDAMRMYVETSPCAFSHFLSFILLIFLFRYSWSYNIVFVILVSGAQYTRSDN